MPLSGNFILLKMNRDQCNHMDILHASSISFLVFFGNLSRSVGTEKITEAFETVRVKAFYPLADQVWATKMQFYDRAYIHLKHGKISKKSYNMEKDIRIYRLMLVVYHVRMILRSYYVFVG